MVYDVIRKRKSAREGLIFSPSFIIRIILCGLLIGLLYFTISLYSIIEIQQKTTEKIQVRYLERTYFSYPPFPIHLPFFTNFQSKIWYLTYLKAELFYQETISLCSSLSSSPFCKYFQFINPLSASSNDLFPPDEINDYTQEYFPLFLREEIEMKVQRIEEKMSTFPSLNNSLVFLFGKDEYTKGFIDINFNILLSVEHSEVCGWKSPKQSEETFPLSTQEINDYEIQKIEGITVYAMAPNSDYFQHFIDGLLPKLTQLSLLNHPLFGNPITNSSVKFIVQFHRNHPIVRDILHSFGISDDRIILRDNHKSYLQFDVLIDICQTPFFHPFLWQFAQYSIHQFIPFISSIGNNNQEEFNNIRNNVIMKEYDKNIPYHFDYSLSSLVSSNEEGEMINTLTNHIVIKDKSIPNDHYVNNNNLKREKRYIAYISRNTGTSNRGRIVKNERRVLYTIERHIQQYSLDLELIVYSHSDFENFTKNMNFLNETIAMVGPHGGGLTNIVFTPPDCSLIEFFMVNLDGTNKLEHPGMMMHFQAQLMNRKYFLLRSDMVDDEMNMNVEVGDLKRVLSHLFPVS